MLRTTVGQFLLNDALPESLRDYSRTWDKDSITKVFQRLAEEHPDQYATVSKRLMELGRRGAYFGGGFSVGLKHLRTANAAKVAREQLRNRVREILKDGRHPKEQQEAIIKVTDETRAKLVKDVMAEAVAAKNPLAMQVKSGARGNAAQLNRLLGGDLLYVDHRDESIPFPVMRTYSEGLMPADYMAASFGARKGVVDVKLGTAKSGYYNKLLGQAAHRLLVTAFDEDDGEDEPSPLTGVRGLPVDIEDQGSIGSLLARTTGKYPRNTVITPRILSELQNTGHKRILVRSPLVGGPGLGGVYARDAGIREEGGLPALGEIIGLAASQAIGERVTQTSLGSKHCLAQGTLVRMADGTAKPVEQIVAGEWVLGANMQRVTFPVRVVQRFDNGPRPCFRSVFSAAYAQKEQVSIDCTADHKILGGRRVSSQKDESFNHVPRMLPIGLKSKYFYAYLPIGTENKPEWFNEPMARLVGLLTGDGCYTKSVGKVHLSCYDPSLVEDIDAELRQLNLKLTKLRGHKGYYAVSQVEQTKAQRSGRGTFTPGARNPAKRWLENNGMLGKYAHEKLLPPEISNWSNESVADYLAGLFSADGSWYNVENRGDGAIYVSLGLTSRSLLDGVKKLLFDRFGISVGYIKTQAKNRKHPLHSFNIAQAGEVRRITMLLIDRLVGKKRQEAAAAATFAAKVHDEYRLIRRSQIAIGVVPTFDLEVDHPDHLFVLDNGLIVSNSGGIKGAGRSASGFEYLQQLVNVPETYRGGATHANVDGRVDQIVPAPAGGHFVHIGNEKHYVPADQDVTLKVGDMVEAGDMLSNGLPNPAQIVQHKGIGEGRRYFLNLYRQALKDSGVNVERRNVELVARGLLDHVEMTEEDDDHIPGDVVSYTQLEKSWEPRDGFRPLEPKAAVGKYLERPVLHYTIGTKVGKQMLADLDEFGVKQIDVHDKPPPFRSVMVPASQAMAYDPDWQAQLLAGHQKRNIVQAAQYGSISDEAGTSYVPAAARGITFGQEWPNATLKPGKF